MANLRASDWVASRREDASRSGHPVTALAGPAVVPVRGGGGGGGAFAYVQKRGSRVLISDLRSAGNTYRVDGERLVRTITGGDGAASESGVVIVPDVVTFRALRETVSRSRAARRLVDHLRALDVSSHLVILTEALGRKFFLPSGADPDMVESWRSAFGLSGQSAMNADRRLYGMLTEGFTGGPGQSAVVTAERAESHILQWLSASGLSAECARFSNSGTISAAWSFVQATDPARRDMSRLDGTVFRGRVVKVSGGSFFVQVTPPFKAKVGRSVVILPDDRAGDPRSDVSVTLVDVGVNAAGEFVAEFATGKSHVRQGAMLDLMEKPFIPPVAWAAKSKWTEPSPTSPLKPVRDVPLAVSLAGAPQEG